MPATINMNTAHIRRVFYEMICKNKCCNISMTGFASKLDQELGFPFSYGTTGGGTSLGNFAAKMTATIILNQRQRESGADQVGRPIGADGYIQENSDKDIQRRILRSVITREVKQNQKDNKDQRYYDPGPRVYEALNNGYQMMDMYYGNRSLFWKSRKENIAHFIHHIMFPKGVPFDKDKSGRDTYLEYYNTTVEGWWNPSWGGSAPPVLYKCTNILSHDRPFSSSGSPGPDLYTHSVAMSWVVRRIVQIYGGKIIYDGKDVTYSGIFQNPPDKRDSNIEALDLFQYIGNSGKGIMGAGKVEYHFNGKFTKPTKKIFLNHWTWTEADPAAPIDPDLISTDASGNITIYKDQNKTSIQPIINSLWNQFDSDYKSIWNNNQVFPMLNNRNP